MVLYLGSMFLCGLHVVLLSQIGILIRFLAVESGSTTGPLFSSQCPCGTTLLTLYSIVWDWRVSIAGPMRFYWPKLHYPLLSSTIFLFLFFLSIGFYCWPGVFGFIWCRSVFPCLAVPISFNNNNNNIALEPTLQSLYYQ